MDFRNNLRSLKDAARAGALWGVGLLTTIVLSTTTWHGWDFFLVLRIVGLFSLLTVLPPILFLLVTTAFSVRITEDRVQHLFLNHFVLSEFPIRDFFSGGDSRFS